LDTTSTPYLAILLLASMSIVTTFIGVWLATHVGKNERAVPLGIGFSAGIMLLVSFFELLPEASAVVGAVSTLLVFVLGMLTVASLHWLIPHTHFEHEASAFPAHSIRSAYLVVFGLILHDVPEGFAMANSYMVSPSLGVLVALAIALHNLPEEFAMAMPLIAVKKKHLLYRAAFLSALAEPAGAAIGLLAAGINPILGPFFMAFAAGAMVFVSIHELIPMARRYQQTSMFILGTGLSIVVYLVLALLVRA
jgi:ZIP family zinc transporter